MIDHVAHIILSYAAGAALLPQDAVSILNVLPRHDSVLAAVLSRGFKEHDPALAVKHGHEHALLPFYPTHVLFDDLPTTLKAAGARGDLPTIELLWRLAGPSTLGRLVWVEDDGFIEEVIKNGHLEVLKWIKHATSTAGIPFNWSSQSLWEEVALAGHTNLVSWAIAHKYLEDLHCWAAVLSTRCGDLKIVEWWISVQQDEKSVMEALEAPHALAEVSREGAIQTLDWWWAYTGSTFPEPAAFAEIVDAALFSHDTDAVEWWWTRFLEHRTPEHIFGNSNATKELESFKDVRILDWYWQRFRESRDRELGHFPLSIEQEGGSHGLIFIVKWQTTLPILQWAVEKCRLLDGQKLRLEQRFLDTCVRGGFVHLLDLILCSTEVLKMDWSPEIVKNAVQYGQLGVLEWWERNQDLLPPQNLDCAQSLYYATELDSVGAIAWQHARRFPFSDRDWKNILRRSIQHNSCEVQAWLRDHLDLPSILGTGREQERFLEMCVSYLTRPPPYTIDFLATVFGPGLDSQLAKRTHSSLTMMNRASITNPSPLPLDRGVVKALIRGGNPVTLEWWLRAYLAAGVPFVLPPIFEEFVTTSTNQSARRWVHDVTVTRKIPVLIDTAAGTVVPYVSRPYFL
ncbi:hypothetical protein BC828DRAFT_376204 [Blastocladiella britannica]|nr:hypothetical protein BC828DRAFT_376204 [Blastocladiella britannica]